MNTRMNGFISAAGLGTRFLPVTLKTPKPLIPVGGKPVIFYSLEMMQEIGITDVVINTHHLADVLQSAVGDGSRWNMRIQYSYEPTLLGSAGGLKQAAHLFASAHPMLVLSSDIITNASVKDLISAHQRYAAEMTIGLTWREDVTGAGIAAFDDTGRITRTSEKPQTAKEIFSHWVNASMYVMEPTLLDLIPHNTVFDFSSDLFPVLIQKNRRFYGYPFPEGKNYVIGIDTPELRKRAEQDILSERVFTEKH